MQEKTENHPPPKRHLILDILDIPVVFSAQERSPEAGTEPPELAQLGGAASTTSAAGTP